MAVGPMQDALYKLAICWLCVLGRGLVIMPPPFSKDKK